MIEREKNIVEAVLVDCSAAFHIIDHSLLYTLCYIVDKELPVYQNTEGVI